MASATGADMRTKPSRKKFWITLKFEGNVERVIFVYASNRKTAERRALKRNPTAIEVKKDA